MLISNGKFFKDNKTARVHRMSVIRILIKVPICTKLHEKPCYYFVIIYLKKKNTESQDRRNFDGARPLYIICTRVTTLHSCYNFVLVFSQSEREMFPPIL